MDHEPSALSKRVSSLVLTARGGKRVQELQSALSKMTDCGSLLDLIDHLPHHLPNMELVANRVLAIDPTNSRAMALLAVVRWSAGRSSEAEELLNIISSKSSETGESLALRLVLDPDNPSPQSSFSDWVHQCSNVKALLKIAETFPTDINVVEPAMIRAIEVDDMNPSSWEYLAQVYHLVDGDHLDSKTDHALHRLLTLDPKSKLGLELMLLDLSPSAYASRVRRIAQALLDADPYSIRAVSALVKVCVLMGDAPRALEIIAQHRQRLLALNNDKLHAGVSALDHLEHLVHSGERIITWP